MKVYKNIKDFGNHKYPVVTVGTFDGVHLGHQAIFSEMIREAQENDGETVVVTFHPHPRLVVSKDHDGLKFINTMERKIDLLDNFGIDHLIIVSFTRDFSKLTSEEFIRTYIVESIRARKLIIGYDHHFGKGRSGNFDELIKISKKYKFEVAQVAAQYYNGQAVSSTKIRNALNEGNISLANRMLGYTYSITGKVIEGNRIGRSIGFPTANLEIENHYKLVAAGGVYACKVAYNGQEYKGMANIGYRPTLPGHDYAIEVHIFDFEEDLYGKTITLKFIERIRDEHKFKDLDALKAQLARDRQTALHILSS